jgi:2'-5' RNA ligase
MTDKRRIFIGTFLAPQEQQRLGQLKDSYDGQLSADWQCKIRWVRPEKLHLTWLFIGDVSPEHIAEITGICQRAAESHPPSQLTFTTLTFWPSARGARMIVLTPDVVLDEVIQLQSAVKRQCVKFAEKTDKRYRPHVTLMRFDGVDRKQRLVIPADVPLVEYMPVPLKINSISVIESHLGANGAYEALHTFALTSALNAR